MLINGSHLRAIFLFHVRMVGKPAIFLSDANLSQLIHAAILRQNRALVAHDFLNFCLVLHKNTHEDYDFPEFTINTTKIKENMYLLFKLMNKEKTSFGWKYFIKEDETLIGIDFKLQNEEGKYIPEYDLLFEHEEFEEELAYGVYKLVAIKDTILECEDYFNFDIKFPHLNSE